MSDEHETPSDAAKRLENALERIALAAAQSIATGVRGEPEVAEVKQRLDALIARLRAGLGKSTDS